MTAAEQFAADARAAMRIAAVWQYELAGRLGVTPKHLNQLLKGKVRLRLDHAEAIADALGYDLDVRFVLRHAPSDADGEP